jgi:hypothetical protein
MHVTWEFRVAATTQGTLPAEDRLGRFLDSELVVAKDWSPEAQLAASKAFFLRTVELMVQDANGALALLRMELAARLGVPVREFMTASVAHVEFREPELDWNGDGLPAQGERDDG